MTNMTPEATIIKMRTSNGRHDYRKQILAALVVSLGSFAAGLSKGYTSPAIDSLQAHNGTGSFGVSDQQASWIASLSLLGALFGGVLGGASMRLGRRRVLLYAAPLYSIAWLLTAFSYTVHMIYATSFFAGLLCSVISVLSQVYVSEISVPEVRGRLSALLKILCQVGVLVAFSVGAYLDWHRLALVTAMAPVALFLTLLYIPETPSYLLLKGREEEAARSLQWLRGPEADIQQELVTIRTNILASKTFSDGERYSWRTYCSSRLTRPVLITCGLMMFQRFSGAHTFNFYAVPMFRKIFRNFDPHKGAITVSGVQLIASCLSGLLIDKVGRLPLLIFSGVLMSMALAVFGCYVYYINVFLHTNITAMEDSKQVMESIDLGSYDWIPLLCVLIFTVAFSLGISPISWLLIGELFPLEYRSTGNALATTFSYLCAFVGVKTFVDFEIWIGLYGVFWLYAGIAVCGLIFVKLFVPETKGREMDEMDPKYVESLLISTQR